MKWQGMQYTWERSAYKVLIGKPEGKRALGRPRCRWKYTMKMDLKEIEWQGVDWTYLVQDWGQWWSLVNMAVNIWVP
jgi:hypothetical protein